MVTEHVSPNSPLYTLPPGHLILQLSARRTAAFKLKTTSPPSPGDSVGASYFLYIPRSHPVTRRASKRPVDESHSLHEYPLLVTVHGSGRDADQLRNRWADWAEERQVIILSPLFPCDDFTQEGVDNYKRLHHDTANGAVRYDLLLLDMIEEVCKQWGHVETHKFSMIGFSGGGQFVHRFLYLHPEHLIAASIGAPGQITLLDRHTPWPKGISNTSEIFKPLSVDPGRFKSIGIQLIVGTADTEERTGETTTRFDRMLELSYDFKQNGVKHELIKVEGVGHDEIGVQAQVTAFLNRYFVSPKIANGNSH